TSTGTTSALGTERLRCTRRAYRPAGGVSRVADAGATWNDGSRVPRARGSAGVLGVIARKEVLLGPLVGEQEGDQGGPDQDSNDAGEVGPLVAVQEGRLGAVDD